MRARTTLVVVFAAFFGLGGLVLGVTMVHAAAPPLSPTVVLSIPWGSDVGQVGYRVLQEDGWQGPSTFAVTEDSIYIVDRLNSRLQVFGFDGQVRQVIPLVPDIAQHPYEIEVIGKAVYVAHYDIDQAPGISVLRNGSWHEVRLERLVSGFDGWLHLSRTQEGNLAVRRDVPPEEDTPGVPRWVILNAADALVGQRGGLLASPSENAPEANLVAPDSQPCLMCPPNQQLALTDRDGCVEASVMVEEGVPTNVITLLRDENGNVFARTRPLTEELDRWSTYLTVYSPSLDVVARHIVSLPDDWRRTFLSPSSDVGRTEIVANGRYYEILYLESGLVVVSWDPPELK